MDDSNEAMERIAAAVDTLDNLISAMSMPLSAEMHMNALKSALPRLRSELKEAYLQAGGPDVWSD
jgi:hypothetical protein